MNDSREYVEQLFIESGIKRHLWFTKLGYYKLYGQPRYLYSFMFQIVMVIFLILGIGNLIQSAVFAQDGLTSRILLFFFISSSAGAFSDVFLGDIAKALRFLLAAVIFGYGFFL